MSRNYNSVAGSESSFLFEVAAILKKVTLLAIYFAGNVIFKLFPPWANNAAGPLLNKNTLPGFNLFLLHLNIGVYA